MQIVIEIDKEIAQGIIEGNNDFLASISLTVNEGSVLTVKGNMIINGTFTNNGTVFVENGSCTINNGNYFTINSNKKKVIKFSLFI